MEIQKITDPDKVAELIGEIIRRHTKASAANEPSNKHGLSRGKLTNGHGTSIFIEIEGETYAVPRQSLADVVGDELANKIWNWILP